MSHVNGMHDREEMSNRKKRGLIIYFSILIIITLYVLIYIWPEVQTINTFQMSNHTKFSKQKTEINSVRRNQTSETIHNKTILMLPNKTVSDIFDNQSLQPSQGQVTNIHSQSLVANNEVRLLVLSILFGILGASAHSVASLSSWIGTRKAEGDWGMWYLVRPPVGAALAVITYLIIRAGLIQGAGINDFGVGAVSALVGLMTVQMTNKLRDIFDSLFGITKANADRGEHPARSIPEIELVPERTKLKPGDKIALKAKVTKSDGKAAANAEVTFSAIKTNVIEIESPLLNTDSNGNAVTTLQGKNLGSTDINVNARIEETLYGKIEYTTVSRSINIEVTDG
jgi:hypothetical protein